MAQCLESEKCVVWELYFADVGSDDDGDDVEHHHQK